MKKKFITIISLIIFIFPTTILATNDIEEEIDVIKTKLNLIESSMFLENYPVGSIYMTTNADESTASKMASKYGGTWKIFASGRNITGYYSSNGSFNKIEQTGGNYSTTLSVSNLPSHSHTFIHLHSTPEITISSSGSHTHTTSSKTISNQSYTSTSAGSHTHTFNGGGQALVQYVTSAYYEHSYTNGYKYATNSGWWNNHKKNGNEISSSGAHNHSLSGTISVPSFSISLSGNHTHTVPSMTTDSISTTTSGLTGSGISFTNLEPYITVYIYKRIS